MEELKEQANQRTHRLPNPKWLPVVAIALVLWAAALGIWRSRLQAAPTTALPRPTPAATAVVRSTPETTLTALPTAAGTPAVVPVARDASSLVRQADWLALAQAFDAQRALADIAELASPRYAGRAVGSPGGELAAEWIASRFAEYALQPAGDNGTYFQEFPVPYAELLAMPSFQTIDETGEPTRDYRFRREYTIWMGGYADAGEAEGPVLWVSDGRHDDYDGIDAQGAIVLCRYRFPFDDVLRQALEHGAKAVLIISPDETGFPMRRLARSGALLPQGIPTLLVGRTVVQHLLAGSGLTPDDLTIQYTARKLARRARLNVPLSYEQQATGHNVLGVLSGSDPLGTAQVLILGAHFDHMGADPDGTVWGGANDNASGVAVLLEIARQWQEQGYVPKRTVLFAAWDGEEIGLNGSNHYVAHPSYPLTNTVGMLQLDMVGAGTPELAIDAGGIVAEQSMVSAAELGITFQLQSMGRSDHVPFVGAGVPATLYIYMYGDDSSVIYHVPEDNVDYVDLNKLRAAGQLANLVALNLSWAHEDLDTLARNREQAMSTKDVNALLSAVGPQDEDLRRQEEEWLRGLFARQPVELAVHIGAPLAASDVATATMTLNYRWQATDSPTVASLPVRWVRRGAVWYYGGPAWEETRSTHAVVRHLQQPELAKKVAQQVDKQFALLREQTLLTLPDHITIHLYARQGLGNDASVSETSGLPLVRILQQPVPGFEKASSWPLEDDVILSQSSDLDWALNVWALQRAGWSTRNALWLAQGLLEHQRSADAQAATAQQNSYTLLLLEADDQGTLWPIAEMPEPYTLEIGERNRWTAQAWAMTRYLEQTQGWAGLQNPTIAAFDPWRSALLEPWHLAAQGISLTLQARNRAVLARDKGAFLATVNPQNTVLIQEEAHWFDDLQAHPAQEYRYESRLVALQDDLATVQLTVRYRLAEANARSEAVTYETRFLRTPSGWLYDDVTFSQEPSAHFLLKYQHPDQGRYASTILAEAERAYELVSSDLEFHAAQPIEIKLYDKNSLFCYSIYMSMPTARGWNEPGESIKVGIEDWRSSAYDGIGRLIAHELTHAALFAKGVQHGAVHEGTAQYEASRFDPQWMYTQVRKWRQQVYDLVRSQRPITVADLDNWRTVAPEDLDLLYRVGWDVVTYFRQRYGRETFLEWLRRLGSGSSFQEAFVQATDTPFADFDAAWRESVLHGHIPLEYTALAGEFAGERALQHVQTLAQPAWTGRQAGTPGSQAAAQYVADRFAEYGLQPAGDGESYFQSFTARLTQLASTPLLSLHQEDGQTTSLSYRQAFRELTGGYAGGGQAESTILYVKTVDSEELRFGGRVVLARASDDPWKDTQAAQAHGAGALLLITDKWSKDMAVKTSEAPELRSGAIPVCELTKEAADQLFALAGVKSWQLDKGPPALPLSISARVEVQLELTPAAPMANVLGVLPGSDPQAADQVLILGAHLDHVGSLPDGTVYPGANNDGSGVGVLLEIARLWQEKGYRPRRTVLFVAWDASELQQLGSEYYVANPAYPLSKTSGVIQLDMVGQGAGYYILASANEVLDARLLAHLENAAGQVEGRITFEPYQGGSDHNPLHVRGVPAVLLSWERPGYSYTPEDTPGTIDVKKLQATGRVAALALMTLADE